MRPRPSPSKTERIAAEVMFLIGILALAEVLVRGFGLNRLLITVLVLVVAYLVRGVAAFIRRGNGTQKDPGPR